MATGPVTIEYEGVLNLAQQEDAIFMAVESVLTPYLQQHIGTALRNYELTLTYTQESNPNTYLSTIKVVLVLAGNSAQAVQGLTQEEANGLLQSFFTGSTLKSLGDALLAVGVNVSTLGLYQQSSGLSNSTSSATTANSATGSRLGPTGYASIIAGGAFVIVASAAIMHGRRSQPQFRQVLSNAKDDRSLTSSTEIDDGASSVRRIGIRPARFASRRDKENPESLDLSATQQLIDKYRVLALSATELSDEFAKQGASESLVRQPSHDLSSEGTWSMGYHDVSDPLDHMSEGDLDSTESMSTTGHHSMDNVMAACPAPSAELRMLNGPDLIAATTLPGSVPWTARRFSYGGSSNHNLPLEEETTATTRRRRWHDEAEDEELHPPQLSPSVKGDEGSVTSLN
jgi:hypothetical protein